MTEFIPFAASPQQTNLGDFILESDEDKIVLHGDLEIRRTQISLRRARQLHSIFAKIVSALEDAGDLPVSDTSSDPNAVVRIDNPFESEPE